MDCFEKEFRSICCHYMKLCSIKLLKHAESQANLLYNRVATSKQFVCSFCLFKYPMFKLSVVNTILINVLSCLIWAIYYLIN